MDDNFEDRVEEYSINTVANAYDLDKLYRIREKLVSDGNDLDLIDKAIQRRKEIEFRRKTEEEKKIREEKAFKKVSKRAVFAGLLSGLFGGSSSSAKNSSGLSDWEIHEINNGNYEPMNFEEEDMDEDDFYSDDLD